MNLNSFSLESFTGRHHPSPASGSADTGHHIAGAEHTVEVSAADERQHPLAMALPLAIEHGGVKGEGDGGAVLVDADEDVSSVRVDGFSLKGGTVQPAADRAGRSRWTE
jgi:hypothetical protein